MQEITFKNGLKLIYKKTEGNLTSFTIGFNAGANREDAKQLGIAHVVEHMLFKGTTSRSEYEINKLSDETFGFCNAMTNYPYVVYYGTTLDEDFEKGFEIYADILLNPSFPKEGFNEEIEVICSELQEWKDDVNQFCEDSMLYNSFTRRRNKDLIIGTQESVRAITINQIKSFYENYYTADNCVISIVSSIGFDSALKIVEKYFKSSLDEKVIVEKNIQIKDYIYQDIKPGTYYEYRDDLAGAKIQYCFTIHNLNRREITALKLFNLVFGEGTSSILFDEIRTKRGLAYDINSKIKNETGIKLFTISLGTSGENVDRTIQIINDEIDKVKKRKNFFDEDRILKLCKSYKVRRMLAHEKSIQMSMSLCVYDIMYSDSSIIFSEFEDMKSLTDDEIMRVVNKVFVNASIQVLTSFQKGCKK